MTGCARYVLTIWLNYAIINKTILLTYNQEVIDRLIRHRHRDIAIIYFTCKRKLKNLSVISVKCLHMLDPTGLDSRYHTRNHLFLITEEVVKTKLKPTLFCYVMFWAIQIFKIFLLCLISSPCPKKMLKKGINNQQYMWGLSIYCYWKLQFKICRKINMDTL